MNENYKLTFNELINWKNKNIEDIEMPLTEHLDELRQRTLFSIIFFIIVSISCFSVLTPIIRLLQAPALGVKFLQFAPGEYFFVTIKVILYLSLLISSPFIIYQLLLFILPGMTQNERKIIIPITVSSSTLFVLGISFGYLILVPAALRFFIEYGSDVIEPLWSFEQYFEFIIVLLFSTGFVFQIPIIQYILGFFGIVSGKQMLALWRYVVLFSTIASAILTPSTDPITQTLLTLAFLALYLGGSGIVLLLEKKRENLTT
jgi:sec-independent protein translocase protein TatC